MAFLAGCASKCVLIRSEYFDITAKVMKPKPADERIEIFTGKPNRPYVEVGMVKILARYGTSREAINAEMIRRAREAGADALTEATYGEDKSNDVVLCGKLITTKRNVTGVAKTVIFTDKKE